MILDERLELADATALDTTGTDEDLIGDVIDLGAEPMDFGVTQQLYVVIQITTAVSGTSSTVAFQLVSDAAAAIAKDGTQSYHAITESIPEATLVAGYEIVMAIPPNGGGNTFERYLGVQSVTGVAALSAGAVNIFITNTPPVRRYLPDGNN
jgi:hypothetical protein